MANNSNHSVFNPFNQVPWPHWIGEPEPHWIKHMPGGCVTFGTFAIIVLSCVGAVVVQIIKSCFRPAAKIQNIHREAAIEARKGEAFKDCVGPKLVVVLREQSEAACMTTSCSPLLCPESKVRRELLSALKQSKSLVAVPVSFGGQSPLANHEVWVLGIKEEQLGVCAEVFKMRKLVDPLTIKNRWEAWKRKSVKSSNEHMPDFLKGVELTPFQEDLHNQEKERLDNRLGDKTKMFNTWRPYSERKKRMFVFKRHQDEDHKTIWTLNDVVTIMLGIIGRERAPEGGYPVFLAATEVGEIETIFPLVDEQEDRDEIKAILKSWKTRIFWRKPPLEDIMRIFGPNTAIYFSYMQTYAVWILFPALLAVASLFYHYRYAGVGIKWGAAFNEGWSQALCILLLSGWSSIFFCAWTRQCAILNFRLGQDTSSGDTYGLDGAKLYFRNRGYKVKRKKTVDLKKKWNYAPTQRSPLVRSILMIMTLMAFLGFTICTIASLCWVSDKASQQDYSALFGKKRNNETSAEESYEENENFLMQNLISVACYFVISIPLEGVYVELTRFLTELENLRNRSAFVERLVRRRALFQLINSQGWFLYLAFGKQDMRMLRWQLTVFFLFKPSGLLGTFAELVQNMACHKNQDFGKDQLEEAIEQEYNKAEPNLFDEYLEVSILFSAVLCFAPVFPEGMIVAFFHTIFEYFTDKNKLFLHLRMGLPKRSDLFAIKGWITVWQGLGWLGIVASTWLTHIFLTQIHHEDTKHWEPADWNPKDLSSWGGDVAWVRIVLLEHFLFVFKGYLAVAVQVESDDISQHQEVVDRIFADAELDSEDDKED